MIYVAWLCTGPEGCSSFENGLLLFAVVGFLIIFAISFAVINAFNYVVSKRKNKNKQPYFKRLLINSFVLAVLVIAIPSTMIWIYGKTIRQAQWDAQKKQDCAERAGFESVEEADSAVPGGHPIYGQYAKYHRCLPDD